jgi:hypothetical protein
MTAVLRCHGNSDSHKKATPCPAKSQDDLPANAQKRSLAPSRIPAIFIRRSHQPRNRAGASGSQILHSRAASWDAVTSDGDRWASQRAPQRLGRDASGKNLEKSFGRDIRVLPSDLTAINGPVGLGNAQQEKS